MTIFLFGRIFLFAAIVVVVGDDDETSINTFVLELPGHNRTDDGVMYSSLSTCTLTPSSASIWYGYGVTGEKNDVMANTQTFVLITSTDYMLTWMIASVAVAAECKAMYRSQSGLNAGTRAASATRSDRSIRCQV